MTGRIFRTKQQSVDVDLVYEQSRKHAKTQSVILESLDKLISDNEQNSPIKNKIREEIEYLRRIQNGST